MLNHVGFFIKIYNTSIRNLFCVAGHPLEDRILRKYTNVLKLKTLYTQI